MAKNKFEYEIVKKMGLLFEKTNKGAMLFLNIVEKMPFVWYIKNF